MALTSPAIHFAALESNSLALWNEWLGQWFDGGSHQVGTAIDGNPALVFPKARLLYQLSSMPQPIDPKAALPPRAGDAYHGVSITVTMLSPGRTTMYRKPEVVGGEDQWAESRTVWFFTVRAQQAGTGADTPAGWNSEKLAQVTADRLYAVLANAPARWALGTKGIAHIRPTLPHLIAETAEMGGLYHVRQMTAAGTLRYRLYA